MKIYDAQNQILGRISSVIAKELLKGEKIVVVNSEKAVLSSSRDYLFEKYKHKYGRGDPIHGPFFPKQPENIFRRTVRGMIPWDKERGRVAYRNLKVFAGIPEEFAGKKFEKVKNADVEKLKTKYLFLEEVAGAIGAKKR